MKVPALAVWCCAGVSCAKGGNKPKCRAEDPQLEAEGLLMLMRRRRPHAGVVKVVAAGSESVEVLGRAGRWEECPAEGGGHGARRGHGGCQLRAALPPGGPLPRAKGFGGGQVQASCGSNLGYGCSGCRVIGSCDRRLPPPAAAGLGLSVIVARVGSLVGQVRWRRPQEKDPRPGTVLAHDIGGNIQPPSCRMVGSPPSHSAAKRLDI